MKYLTLAVLVVLSAAGLEAQSKVTTTVRANPKMNRAALNVLTTTLKPTPWTNAG